MPFDSSKVKFHDERDMFFRMKEARNPSKEQIKKKFGGAQKAKPQVNEYLSAYENRKKEQSERRFKMLFLKRLENDGA